MLRLQSFQAWCPVICCFKSLFIQKYEEQTYRLMIITVRCNKNGFLKADRLQRWLCIHVFSGGNGLEIFLKRHLNVYLMLETFH